MADKGAIWTFMGVSAERGAPEEKFGDLGDGFARGENLNHSWCTWQL